MTIPIIRIALEKRLAALTPAIDTAYENVAYSSTTGVPYQKAHLMVAMPDNRTLGSALYFEQGYYQITLCYPVGVGPGALEARAQLLRAWFKRGSSLTEQGVIVNIIKTPEVRPAIFDGDRYCVPVMVWFQAQIATP